MENDFDVDRGRRAERLNRHLVTLQGSAPTFGTLARLTSEEDWAGLLRELVALIRTNPTVVACFVGLAMLEDDVADQKMAAELLAAARITLMADRMESDFAASSAWVAP